jgi:hypothetical protein
MLSRRARISELMLVDAMLDVGGGSTAITVEIRVVYCHCDMNLGDGI